MELAPELEGSFKDRAEEARRIMAEVRGEAEKQGAGLRDAFQEGLSSASAAEAAFKGRAFASAAREFMKAARQLRTGQAHGPIGLNVAC